MSLRPKLMRLFRKSTGTRCWVEVPENHLAADKNDMLGSLFEKWIAANYPGFRVKKNPDNIYRPLFYDKAEQS